MTTGPGHHIVQFYEDGQCICRDVARYLASGLAAGEPVVAIATSEHRDLIGAELRAEGFDLLQLRRSGALTLVDAADTLGAFMVNDRPDALLFKKSVGSLLHRVQGGDARRPIRAYGEMVDVLWHHGRSDAALQLEQLWNDLAESHCFSLLCGYSLEHFRDESHAHKFQQTCHQHTHVIPTEHYLHADSADARRREISRLQQRSRALDTQIDQRKRLERSLLDALVDRERAEAERVHLLIAERRARADADDAVRFRDEFLSMLSQELRTPLHAILDRARRALTGEDDPSSTRQALRIMYREARLQLHRIDDLLDMSDILAGTLRLQTEPIELAELVTAVIEFARPSAYASHVTLGLEIDPPSAASAGYLVIGDAKRLRQVLWNLVSNAIKFTPEGGRIFVSLDADEGHARIVVRDSGQGIAPDALPHVFDRFCRGEVEVPRASGGGLGLGLAVAQPLVEAHGGTLSAQSAGEGHGSCFVVLLPLMIFPRPS